jgi:hypothetical protein
LALPHQSPDDSSLTEDQSTAFVWPLKYIQLFKQHPEQLNLQYSLSFFKFAQLQDPDAFAGLQQPLALLSDSSRRRSKKPLLLENSSVSLKHLTPLTPSRQIRLTPQMASPYPMASPYADSALNLPPYAETPSKVLTLWNSFKHAAQPAPIPAAPIPAALIPAAPISAAQPAPIPAAQPETTTEEFLAERQKTVDDFISNRPPRPTTSRALSKNTTPQCTGTNCKIQGGRKKRTLRRRF